MGTHATGGGWRRSKRQPPDYLWPEIWKDISEAAQRKEKRKWACRKTEEWQRWKIVHFIDPADAEIKETIRTMRGESWKFRCQQQCLARSGKERTRQHVAILMLPRQNTQLKPTSLGESVYKELYTKIMKAILQGKGVNSLNHYNLLHKFILMLKAMKIPDAKAAVDK